MLACAAEIEERNAWAVFECGIKEADVEVVVGHGEAAADDSLVVEAARRIGEAELGSEVVILRIPEMVFQLEGDVDQLPAGSGSEDGGRLIRKPLLRAAAWKSSLVEALALWVRVGGGFPVMLDIRRDVLGTEVALRQRRSAGGWVGCNLLEDGCIVCQCPEPLKGIGGALLAVEIVVVLFPANFAAEANGVGAPGMGRYIAQFVGVFCKDCRRCGREVCSVLNGKGQRLHIDEGKAVVDGVAGVVECVLGKACAVAASSFNHEGEKVWM